MSAKGGMIDPRVLGAGATAAKRRDTARDSSAARTASGAGVAPAQPTLASRLVLVLLGMAIVLSTIAYGAVSSWALAFFQASACLVVLLWGWDALGSGRLRFSRNLLQLPLAALVVIGVCQLLPSGGRASSLDPFQTLIATIKTTALLIYFAAALAFIDSPARLRLAARIIIVFGFLLAIGGMVQSFVSPDSIYGMRTPYQAFPFGPFVNRHHFANYMLMALAVPLGLLFAGAVGSERRLLMIFAAAIMGVALVATGSRGAMVSFVVQIGFLVAAAGVTARAAADKSDKRDGKASARSASRAWLLRAGAGAGALLLVLIGVLTLGGEAGLTRLVGTVNSDDPTTGRTHFWSVTLEIIKDHPSLGAGLGAFATAYTRYDSRSGMYRIEQAHNDYLQLISDAGIIGGVFGLLFVIVLYRVGWHRLSSVDPYRRGIALGALAACTGVFAHAFFEFALHTTSNALLFLVLAAFATLGGQVEQPPAPKRRRRRRPVPAAAAAAAAAIPATTDVNRGDTHEETLNEQTPGEQTPAPLPDAAPANAQLGAETQTRTDGSDEG